MLNGIVEGLLIGASGSVVAMALLGFSGWLRRRYLRIEQIRFMRRLLCDALSKLNTKCPRIYVLIPARYLRLVKQYGQQY